jgi:hypothetical protein
MWRRTLSLPVSPDERERLIVAPHHPDRLRRPAAPVGAVAEERFRQALLWNVFRSLELIQPWLWLRRFHLRLTGEPALVPPQILAVHLWRPLPLPPVQRIDGHRPATTADVVIETEHAVWTLVTESTIHLADADTAAAVVDAGAWFAGARQHYCGVIESTATATASTLRARYSRSKESARLQSATTRHATPVRASWGGIRYPDLMALLQECCEARRLPPIERVVARNALDWLSAVGIGTGPFHSAEIISL